LFESGCHGLTGDLGIVARLGFSGRDIADRLEEAPVVEPVDPFQGGKLDKEYFPLKRDYTTARRICNLAILPVALSIQKS
jgi:hypothetical protein